MPATDSEIFIGIAEIIKEVIPNMTLIIKGIEHPSVEKVDEWIQLEMLKSDANPSRINNFYSHYAFQLIAFTRPSNQRSDKNPFRHLDLGDTYKPYFNKSNYCIKSSCIRFQEAKISYLDLRTATFTAKAISTGGTPPLDTLCAVILSEACIDQPS